MSDHDHDAPHHEHGAMKIEAQEHTFNGFVKACAIVTGLSIFVLIYLAACVA